MDFLKKLFGGGGGAAPGERGMLFYVQPTGCEEVIRVRVDAMNDPSLSDDESHYFVRKTVRGSDWRCNRPAELLLTFDMQKRLTNTGVSGGRLVEEADYAAWQAAHPQE